MSAPAVQSEAAVPTALLAVPVAKERACIEAALAGGGYRVIACASGAEILGVARELCPQLILVAERLPDVDGLEVLRALRAGDGCRQSVCLAIVDVPGSCLPADEHGADDELVRPVTTAAVAIRVRQAIKHANTQHWLDILCRAGAQIASARDLGAVFADVAISLRRIMPIDHFVLAREDGGEVAFEIVDTGNACASPQYSARRLPRTEACEQRFQIGACSHRQCARVGDRDEQLACGMLSCVCFPLHDGERRLGALSLSSRDSNVFRPEHLPHLESLALQVAHTVASVERYRKSQAEADRLATIVREVHHRIKNNLQGVIGLLGGYRDEHRPLAPVLNHAISQLHAVAEVHNLLSRHTREIVSVHELIQGIYRSLQPLCEFRLYLELGADTAGLAVSSGEAVPLALVLNELVQNARDHGYPGRPVGAIRIVLERCANEVLLKVANDGAAPASTPADARFAGMGLTLVRSLLSARDTCFRLSRDAGWTVAEVKYQRPESTFQCLEDEPCKPAATHA